MSSATLIRVSDQTYQYNAITHIPLHHINLSRSLIAAAPPDAGVIRTT